MRLICPNCGAQYEVDDSLVPDSGRDVQCSNCGHAWFQGPPHLDPDLAEELGTELPEDSGPPPGTHAEEPEAEEPEAEEPEPPPVPARPIVPPAARGAPPAATVAPRPTMDDSIRSILSEEAERETRARQRETVIETQGDLGLTAAARPAGAASQRPAKPQPAETDSPAAAAAGTAGSRRDLLPDIEEINSSLRSAEEREEDQAQEAQPARPRGGSRLGFSLVLLIAVLAIVVYVFADRLAVMWPAAEPALNGYVALVDSARAWLDGVVEGWLNKLNGAPEG